MLGVKELWEEAGSLWGRWAGPSQGPHRAKCPKLSSMEGGMDGHPAPASCACSSWGGEVWEFVVAGNRRKDLSPSADVRLQNTSSVLVSKSSAGEGGIRGSRAKASSTWPLDPFTPSAPQEVQKWQRSCNRGAMEEGKRVSKKRGEELSGAARAARASHPGGFHSQLCVISGSANLFAYFQICSSLPGSEEQLKIHALCLCLSW